MKATFLPKFEGKKKNAGGFGDWENPVIDIPHRPAQQGGISCLFCNYFHMGGGTHALGKATQKTHAANTGKREGSLFLAAVFIRSGPSPNRWVDAEMNRVK